MSGQNELLIGVVADDFTGASDAASFLVKGGLNTLLLNGIPSGDISLENISAIVIALKTRTMEKNKAVELSLEAFDWLKAKGARHIYSKYCSTFDSTREGNIGPIIDAVLEKYNYQYTIIAPSLPVNGRTVRNGHLYVYGVPLHESSMKDHPLTPMWDSRISILMREQGKYKCVEIHKELLHSDDSQIQNLIHYHKANNEHFYIIPDYEDEKDAERITELFKDLPFLTGGSGLLESLARAYKKENDVPIYKNKSSTKGKAIILSGSLSQATRSQVNTYLKTGKPALKINPLDILRDNSLSWIWDFIDKNQSDDIMIYSLDEPLKVKEYQKLGKEKVAKAIEETFAKIAKRIVNLGYTRIIVAGGETSGAVTQALNLNHFVIGESVCPGVPIMIPLNYPEIRLVLKSGNFGDENFFIKALKMTEET